MENEPAAPPLPVPPAEKKTVTPSGEQIRKRLLGAAAREVWAEVENPDSGELERYCLISPTVRQANSILQRAMQMPKGKDAEDIKASDVTIDNAEMQVQALIYCLRDPDTKQPLLDQTNREALLDGPLSYLFSALAVKAQALFTPSLKTTKKN